MAWLWPKSLLGQMLLAVAVALLIAQSISAILLWRAGDNRRDQIALNSAAFRLASDTRNDRQEASNRRQGEPREQRRGTRRRLMGTAQPGRLPPRIRLVASKNSPLLPGETRQADLESDLKSILQREGVTIDQLVVLERRALDDPLVKSRPNLVARLAQSERNNATFIVAGLRSNSQDEWRVARVVKLPPQPGAFGSIILQTLLIYLLLVGLHFLLLRRITRPLAALTTRTQTFGNSGETANPLEPQGPPDIRRLISAHNAMEARINALLDEKDVMLGAIGHDLKTPLAALRVRIESVEDENERSKMAESIEDISRSLDDILSLARVGRASEPPEKAELSTLVASVVEEFEDLDSPVTLAATHRIVGRVHVTWLKRGLRNLIDNALRYAGTAEVALNEQNGQIILRVDDNGPGIPVEALADMLEPFKRGDASRNRGTGGAGLGLTLARAIAEQHGGSLVLANREEGGLRAEIRLPLG